MRYVLLTRISSLQYSKPRNFPINLAKLSVFVNLRFVYYKIQPKWNFYDMIGEKGGQSR